MNDGTFLDGLLALVIVFYVPVAALRGGLRETILGGSILLGGVLAVTRPERWGTELAELTGWSEASSAFVVAACCIFGSALFLGIGGGSLCDQRVPSLGGRGLGAVIGGLNATVAIGLTLRAYETLALGGERRTTISESYVARNLIDRFDLVILGSAVVLLGSVIAGHVLHRVLGVSYSTDIEPALTWVQSTQRPARSIRIPAEADAGKVEPLSPADSIASTVASAPAIRWVEPARASDDRATPHGPSLAEPHWFDARDAAPDDSYLERARRDDDESIVDRWLVRGPDGGSNGQPTRSSTVERDMSLAELHRLLHMDPLPETQESNTTRFDDKAEQGVFDSSQIARCPRCHTLLPDATLPCPFCDDR